MAPTYFNYLNMIAPIFLLPVPFDLCNRACILNLSSYAAAISEWFGGLYVFPTIAGNRLGVSINGALATMTGFLVDKIYSNYSSDFNALIT